MLARRVARAVPHLVVNTGMLPHQLSAFLEGLFGPMHGEFERTPKAATVTGATVPPPRLDPVKVHRPYVLAEASFVLLQGGWALLFLTRGLWWCAAGALFVAACVLAMSRLPCVRPAPRARSLAVRA